MSIRRNVIAAAALLAASAVPGVAASLRYANQGDLKSLDPYTINETTTNAHLGHVYEGLTARGKDLAIEPALAERWETRDDGLRWRFYLRKGVKFQNGNDFNADDVLFSAERVRMKGSNFTTRIPTDAKFVKVDDHTVDVVLTSPNPILHAQWDSWYIMDKEWSEANNAVVPTAAAATSPGYAALHTNGTGPFVIESHLQGVKTVFKPNPNYWGKVEHNLDEIVFTPIGNDATRLAALLSGEVDIIEPVPLQDLDRVRGSANHRVLAGPELRTIFLNFDQTRDELLFSNVKGKNPFKDVRVREAFYRAIDINLIRDRVMRGLSRPSALLIAPELVAHGKDFVRPALDLERSKKLLAEAGDPNGFEVGMDCPSDRYVNDEAICQAVTSMLARVGIKVNLTAQPKARFFAKAGSSGGFQTSFAMLGWTPGTFDAHNVLHDIMGCRDVPGSSRGDTNYGGYCNKELDALTDKILVETDKAKRDDMIKQAFEIGARDWSHIPLHQQSLAWGVTNKVTIVQRPDNQVLLYWARKEWPVDYGSGERIRRLRAVIALCAVALVAGPVGAQGVVVPTPGSAPTVAGPSSTNPSAAASGGLGATNPSAASSAVTTPNALNPSGTSSTFAPTSIGGTDRVLTRAAPQTPVVRERARSRPRHARARAGRKGEAREARPVRRAAKAVLLPPAVMKERDARARRITGSVCRGC